MSKIAFQSEEYSCYACIDCGKDGLGPEAFSKAQINKGLRARESRFADIWASCKICVQKKEEKTRKEAEKKRKKLKYAMLRARCPDEIEELRSTDRISLAERERQIEYKCVLCTQVKRREAFSRTQGDKIRSGKEGKCKGCLANAETRELRQRASNLDDEIYQLELQLQNS